VVEFPVRLYVVAGLLLATSSLLAASSAFDKAFELESVL
jgi:hypothetical protein